MYRCLQVAEVAQIIADDIDSKSTLLSMGLTCRTLFDPAMNTLWRTLRRPRDIVRVLPAHTRGTGEKELTLVKRPSQQEWERFSLYARRVRCFENWFDLLDFQDANETASEIGWDSIEEYYPGDCMFPNLLQYRSSLGFRSLFGKLFLHPPLRHLALRYMLRGSRDVPDFMQSLINCAGTLETLYIRLFNWTEGPGVIDDMLVHAIGHLSHLRELSVGYLPPETIEHLATLPALTKLSFVFIQDEEYSSKALTFPALRSLTISIFKHGLEPLSSFLENVTAPQLEALRMIYHPSKWERGVDPLRLCPPVIEVSALLSAAAAFPRLRSIEYTPYPPQLDIPLGQRQLCTASILTPLLALPELREIHLERLPILLMSHDIATCARAWPHIRVLRLGDAVHGAESSVQVQDLLPLVRGCPELVELGLPLLIPEWSYPPIVAPPFGTSTALLKSLYVSKACISYSPEAAAFLASVFPHMDLHPEHYGDATLELLRRTMDTFHEMTAKFTDAEERSRSRNTTCLEVDHTMRLSQ